MSNSTSLIKGQHGLFNVLNNDEYLGQAIKEYGEYSEIELSLIQQIIKKGDYIFDVGANLGLFTIPFAKKVGNIGKVFCFEPQKFISKILRKNIDLNLLKNVKVNENGLDLIKRK